MAIVLAIADTAIVRAMELVARADVAVTVPFADIRIENSKIKNIYFASQSIKFRASLQWLGA